MSIKMSNKIEEYKNKISYLLDKYSFVCLFLIFSVFLFSRMYHIGLLPAGIHYDEAGMAFDAKTLAAYGTDRHNNSFPLYLPAYGGGQSAMYAYSLALLLKFLPFSMFMMRLPAVLYGCGAFFTSYLVVKDIWDDRRWALMGPILVTIIPYFMMSERWALDCNLFLSWAVISFYFFFHALKSEKPRYYAIAGITLGLTLYTYILSYIVLPVFLALVIIWLIAIKKFNFKNWLFLCIPLGILALPLIIIQLINAGYIQPFSIFVFDFPKLGFFRGTEFSISAIFKHPEKLWKMIWTNEPTYFNYIEKFGAVYLFMVPFIILGMGISIANVVNSFRKETLDVYFPIVAFTIAGYLSIMIIDEEINIYNGNELFFMFSLFIVIAMKYIHDKISIATPVVLAVFALYFLLFSNYYFRYYVANEGMKFMFVSTEYCDVVSYVENNLNPNHKKVYFMTAPEHRMYPEIFVGMAVTANPETWEEVYDTNDIENIHIGLPEPDFDLDEDCIYIMSNESYGHIAGYFIGEGWSYDNLFPSYTIIYR